MVLGVEAVLFRVPGEQREVENPGDLEGVRVVEVQLFAEACAKGGQGRAADLARIGHVQEQVAVFALHTFDDGLLLFLRKELGDRGFELAAGDFEVGEAFRRSRRRGF